MNSIVRQRPSGYNVWFVRWDSLDRAALISIGVLLVLAAAVIARGDQVGLAVMQTNPAHGEVGASVRSSVQVIFNEAPNLASLDERWRVEPPVSGTLRANGPVVFWTPTTALAPNQTYTMTIDAGVTSQRGRTLLRPVRWSFHTRQPRIVYLAPASGYANLFVLDTSDPGAAPQRLTEEPYGVYDFAVSPNGRHIAYSVNREAVNPERDLWLINSDGSGRRLIVRCDGHICQSPSWSHDGALIAFQKHPLLEGTLGRSPGPGRIWILNLESQQAAPLFEDSQRIGSLPRFAPRDTRLAFYDGVRNVIHVINLADGNAQELPSVMGDTGNWSPDGTQLVYPELVASDAGQFSQLLRTDLISNVIVPLTPLGAYNDLGAAWSPDGEWIAFGRQDYTSGINGAQVWLLRASGGSPIRLTEASGFNYGAISWSPDSRYLLAQRFDLVTPNATPEVWLLSADGATQRLIAVDAMLPAWLP